MNDNIKSHSSKENMEQGPLVSVRNVSLNQSLFCDDSSKHTTTQQFLMNHVNDYSIDGEAFNELHPKFFYYFYPNLFTSP